VRDYIPEWGVKLLSISSYIILLLREGRVILFRLSSDKEEEGHQTKLEMTGKTKTICS